MRNHRVASVAALVPFLAATAWVLGDCNRALFPGITLPIITSNLPKYETNAWLPAPPYEAAGPVQNKVSLDAAHPCAMSVRDTNGGQHVYPG
jgi:hypothetical protein